MRWCHLYLGWFFPRQLNFSGNACIDMSRSMIPVLAEADNEDSSAPVEVALQLGSLYSVSQQRGLHGDATALRRPCN